jgi:ribonuclease HI
MAGAGRIILDPEGKEENSYARGLGKDSDNQDEVLALFQGLRIIDERQYRSIIIIGDSKSIIRSLYKGTGQGQRVLSQILYRINKELEWFERV